MGLFDFFRDKKESEDHKPSDQLTVSDLKKGYIIDYFMKSWEVKACYEYDWGNNFFSKEFKLDAGDEVIYLSVEEDDEITLAVSRGVPLMSIDKNLKYNIIDRDEPGIREIVYKGKVFYYNESSQGIQRDLDYYNEPHKFVAWEYTDEEEKEFIYISRWGEEEIEAAHGEYVENYEFSNILPVKH